MHNRRRLGNIAYWGLAALVLAALAAAAAVLGALHPGPDPSVALALDAHRLERVSRRDGVPFAEALERMRRAGVAALVTREQSLAELEDRGVVQVRWGWELLNEQRLMGKKSVQAAPDSAGAAAAAGAETAIVSPWRLYVHAADEETFDWLKTELDHRWRLPVDSVTLDGAGWLALTVSKEGPAAEELRPAPRRFEFPYTGSHPYNIMTLPLGFWAPDIEAVLAAGLQVIPQVSVRAGERTPAAALGPMKVLPAGTVLLVHRDGLPGGAAHAPAWADYLEGQNWLLGVVWGQAPAGQADLAAAIPDRLVKVHPMWPGEPRRDQVIAVRDRQVRLLYYERFVGLDDPGALGNLDPLFFDDLFDALADAGFQAGAPAPLPQTSQSAYTFVLVAAALPAMTALAAPAVWGSGVKPAVAAAGWAGALLLAGLAWLSSYVLPENELRQVVTFLLALVAPVAAVAAGLAAARSFSGAAGARFAGAGWADLHHRPSLTAIFAGAAATAAVSVGGGALIAAVLAEPLFHAQVLQFRGVGAALLLPAVLLAAAFMAAVPGSALETPAWRGRLVQLMGVRVTGGHVAVALLILAAAAMVWLRSGNFPLIPVADWELQGRVLLDQWLTARPRTKEWLLGYPALVLMLAWGGPRSGHAAALLGLGAVIGQTSVVNTFAHVHTPAAISLLRTFHGWWLGLLIGTVLLVISRYLARRWAEHEERTGYESL
ncbi:MAG: DUF5693 family protein [Thermaerobacterales bacterium]